MIKIIFAIVLSALVINILVINYWILNINNNQSQPEQPTNIQTAESINELQTTATSQSKNSCSDSCLDYINQVLDSSQARDSEQVNTQAQSSVSEVYIPLGSGNSFAGDWEEVTGLEASIDTSNYKNISKVTFELTMLIPNGNQDASVRLYNKTDKHPVWFSELSHKGGEAKALFSNPIQLDEGNNTYIVQAKTQLKNEVKIINSRIKIINK